MIVAQMSLGHPGTAAPDFAALDPRCMVDGADNVFTALGD
jgi:hypothetical protein